MLERDQNTLGFYLKARRCREFEREPRYFWFILEDYLVNQKKFPQQLSNFSVCVMPQKWNLFETYVSSELYRLLNM